MSPMLLFAILASLVPAGAAAGEKMPLRLIAGRPVVAAYINGQGPYDLILDTGAVGALLNGDLVDEIGLASQGRDSISDPAGGAGTEVERHTIDRLRVGNAEVAGVSAVSWRDERMVRGLGGARGVLGLTALAGKLVTYDFPAKELIIEDGSLSEGDGSVAYFSPQPIPSVAVEVAGETLEGHIDTGNPGAIQLPLRLRDRLQFDGPLRNAKARTVGGEFELLLGRLNGSVVVAGNAVENPQVTLGDRYPWANVGRGILGRFALTVDPANRRVWIRPSSTPLSDEPEVAVKPAEGAQFGEYAGVYGKRTVVFENGALFMHRNDVPLEGAAAQGMPVTRNFALDHIAGDEFRVHEFPASRLVFGRGEQGKIVEMRLLNMEGEWETAPREP